MASIAARFHMSTHQWIFGRIMIESGLAPIHLIVTLTTVVRKSTAVCVIVQMTILALSQGVAPRDLGLVAFSASHG